jgi:hypothetical protein
MLEYTMEDINPIPHHRWYTKEEIEELNGKAMSDRLIVGVADMAKLVGMSKGEFRDYIPEMGRDGILMSKFINGRRVLLVFESLLKLWYMRKFPYLGDGKVMLQDGRLKEIPRPRGIGSRRGVF